MLLDALGTLVELEPPVEPLRRELRERFGVDVSEAEAAGRAARRDRLLSRASRRGVGSGATGGAAPSRDRGAARRAASAAAALPLEALTDALLAALRFRPFSEVPEVLRAASERGARLVVVSNWDVSLHDVLEQTRLAPLVDGVITSAELGSAKPDGAIFARGLALAGVGAKEAMHVGDSVEHDVAGALAAGIEPLLVVRDGSLRDAPIPPGVRTIATLRPLLDLLDGAGSVSFSA